MKHFKIAFEQQSSKIDIVTEAMAIAQEGKIEQIKSFFQQAVSTKESMKKAITSLQGKEVNEVFEQEDGGKFSGLKLLDVDKVDGKAIIKYLELIKKEKDRSLDIVRTSFAETKKAVKILKSEVSEENLHNLREKMLKVEEKVEEYYDTFEFELKDHKNTIKTRNKIIIKSANKVEFDKIISIFISLTDNSYLKELEDTEVEIWGYYGLAENHHGVDASKTLETVIDLSSKVNKHLQSFIEFEDKFLFSLMKYLQISVK